ncbi:YcgL domain-containing protein [Permianibacter sp. IMCC34836]|uniref:YcgL domain-containing protein n=1 Tax=Permianibacter fluminis TaxID=2738515 RepID=UPI00155796F9|nr:YcgL domain-containing protein [Permianibacter fluminis]NQD38844.1 YcgL domain-containing protein [Permianibacter fluminis]
MKCYIYRSSKQDEMYLYLRERDQFDTVPAELLNRFGKAEWVMELDLASRSKLARENIDRVRAALQERGFYLQLPPQIEAHLDDGD